MNQFDGRKGLAISMDSPGMECAPEVSRTRHRPARALIPSTLLTAALVLTGCSGAGSTEGESLPGENRISTDGSSVGTVPTNAEASDMPMVPYGGGPGVDDGGNAAGDGGASEGPDAGGVDSGSAAGGGADANPGAEGSGALSGNDAPNEGDAAEDNSAPNGGADQPEGVDGNEGTDATAAGPEGEANGTGKSTDNADVNEGASGIDGNGAGSNGKASDGDEAPARAGLSGAFKNMSKACKAISAQMLSIAFAPLTYSYGGGRAEAKQAVSELSQLKKKVPAELRDDFDKVEEVFAESGHAYSNFDEAAFEEAVIPIEEWVLENCPKLH